MKPGTGGRLFDGLNIALMLGLVFATFYPLFYIFIVSVSDGSAVMRGEVKFWPKGFNWDTYSLIFKDPSIVRSYGNTFLYTAVGTLINLVCTALCAYPLSKKDFYGRSAFTLMIVITMFFSGGLIPTYLLVQKLGMLNTMWALVIPGAISVWNMIIMRTFFQGIPAELYDSAHIDGAGELKALVRITLPLSKPIMTTLGMFYAVGHWNSFFPAMIYLDEKAKFPLQIILRNMVLMGEMSNQSQEISGVFAAVTATNIKYAVIIIAVLPIVMVYPFIQKYFIKGAMVGSLKG
ncbi:MAG: lplC5 [Paenibacillus sp.]|jgi:putative aldouronate transport system permease protein|uniref:Carbohydrate ABC transporter permease n=1 Tax=Paenibacillus hemerocallicola TaxID=1172614 RepID=A0A5C4TD85_9BACL|nr:carbohydrate ABC transporter permease [Paenibacillus hemerocallicola]MDF2659923.1 lplC5 [Paenibacillus sp.]TNJ67033.1 carbohydrate ABC transporter permease [Paenibacillus hemerocallicola]